MAETLQIDVIAKTLGIKSLTDLRSAFQMVGQVIDTVKNVANDLTNAFIEQEKQDTQLNAVLKSTEHAAGLSAKEIKSMASELQTLTGIGDETTQRGQNLLLTFTKIGKEVFPEATKVMLDMSVAMGQDVKSTAIQMGKALNDPITGITALSRVGVQLTDDQKNLIKTMTDAGDIAGAQKVILKELETQFGGSAKAARDTYGGALKALESTQGDLKETLGGLIATIGRDFVESMISGTKAIDDFLKDSKRMSDFINFWSSANAKLGGVRDVFFELSKVLAKNFAPILKTIASGIKDLTQGADDNNIVFTALIGSIKILSIALGISTKSVNLIVTAWFGLAKAIKSAIGIIVAFFDAATGKKKWSEIWEAVKNTGNSIKEFGIDVGKTSANMIKDTINEFKNFPTEVKKTAAEMKDHYKNNYEKISKLSTDSKEVQINNFRDVSKGLQNNEEAVKNYTGAAGLAIDKLEAKSKAASGKIKSEWEKAWDSTSEKFKEWHDNTFSGIESIVGAFQEMGNSVMDLVNVVFDNMVAANEMAMNNQLGKIDEKTQQTLKLYGLEEKTKSEQIAKEIVKVNDKLRTESDAEQRTRLLEQKRELENEQKKAEILENAEREKTKTTEKYMRQEQDLRVKQFRANQAAQIANVWIAAALGIVQAWASSMLMPFPANVITAGVLTGIMATTAGIQTGVIAAQSPPAFELGGMTQGGQILVGERGPEILEPPAGSMIRNNAETRSIMSNQENSGNIYIDTVIIQTNNPKDFFDEMIEIKRFEMGRA